MSYRFTSSGLDRRSFLGSTAAVTIMAAAGAPKFAFGAEKVVKIGFLAPLTGAVAAWGKPGYDGCLIWADWINAAGGDWNVAANWQDTSDLTNRVPDGTDDACVTLAGDDPLVVGVHVDVPDVGLALFGLGAQVLRPQRLARSTVHQSQTFVVLQHDQAVSRGGQGNRSGAPIETFLTIKHLPEPCLPVERLSQQHRYVFRRARTEVDLLVPDGDGGDAPRVADPRIEAGRGRVDPQPGDVSGREARRGQSPPLVPADGRRRPLLVQAVPSQNVSSGLHRMTAQQFA